MIAPDSTSGGLDKEVSSVARHFSPVAGSTDASIFQKERESAEDFGDDGVGFYGCDSGRSIRGEDCRWPV